MGAGDFTYNNTPDQTTNVKAPTAANNGYYIGMDHSITHTGQGGSTGSGRDRVNTGVVIAGNSWIKNYAKNKADVIALFPDLNADQRGQLKAWGYQYGWKSAKAAWSGLVNLAKAHQDKGELVSPFDFFSQHQGPSSPDNGGSPGPGSRNGPGSSGGGSHSFSQSQTSVNLTDAATAHGLADQALNQYLGRAASPSEIAHFKQLLNADESKHPTTTNTSGVTGATNTTSSSTTTGGTSPTQDAVDFGKAQHGAAEYQYATTYGDAFNQALGTPVAGT